MQLVLHFTVNTKITGTFINKYLRPTSLASVILMAHKISVPRDIHHVWYVFANPFENKARRVVIYAYMKTKGYSIAHVGYSFMLPPILSTYRL